MGEDAIRTVLLQICDIDAQSINDVILFIGEGCYREFLDEFEKPQSYRRLECYVYNLRYEFPWLLPYISERYRWSETIRDERTGRKNAMDPGTWNCVEDAMAIYEVEICNRDGVQLRIRDDMRRGSPLPMRTAAEFIRMEYPEWWDGINEVKEETEIYNDWWTLPSSSYAFRSFLHYARIDAYSQAMISRYYRNVLGNKRLTLSSYAMDKALAMTYDQENIYYAKRNFRKDFPPLTREYQDIVEKNLLGGFVYAVPGDHKGTFVHIDYSSSYPYEYAYGDLFAVCKSGIQVDCWSVWDDPEWIKWVIVSFDFEIKENGLPLLQYAECIRQEFDPLCTSGSLKMREGKIIKKLMTKTYYEELKNHYYIFNEEIHELLASPIERGKFRKFIEYCYNNKQRPELKGTMQRDIFKRMMNAGIHGKTITKTHRRKIVYPGGEKVITNEVNEPTMLSLIGFTAMMHARERLVRHARILQEHGVQVMQCDTDSIVARGTEAQVREILGPDAFYVEGDISTELGKFEFEEFNGIKEFDRFKSWGLKRYCEIQDGVYRKSAFAGMHDEAQYMLIDAPTDGTYFTWKQKKTRQLKNTGFEADFIIGRVVYKGEMKACLQDIWYKPRYTPEDWIARGYDMYESLANNDVHEDMIAELIDDCYGEKDRYWRKHVRKAYNRKKMDEQGRD